MSDRPAPGPRFVTDFDPRYGECVEVAPDLRRVVARNPSKYTAWGTGTYLVGRGEVAVIDPGPALDEHVAAVLAAVRGETVTHVLVTHTHADHSPATAAVVAATGATTYGFGPHPAAAVSEDPDGEDPDGEDADGEDADAGEGEEHGDLGFVPDVAVRDGDVLHAAGTTFECLHTPGHISNHVCFAQPDRRRLFTGDHVMGWSTTVIPPPDGDLGDYLANLRRLLERDDEVYLPTHGPPVTRPREFVAELLAHREERSRQILEELAHGPRTPEEVVAVIYAEVRPELHAPAARSVRAHLLHLRALDRVAGPDDDGRWRRA
ncbi:MAG: MBL fold metallo-hydrolase [Microthrixaceae bacterium]